MSPVSVPASEPRCSEELQVLLNTEPFLQSPLTRVPMPAGFTSEFLGLEERAQHLGAFAALTEEVGPIPNTHMEDHKSSSRGLNAPSLNRGADESPYTLKRKNKTKQKLPSFRLTIKKDLVSSNFPSKAQRQAW